MEWMRYGFGQYMADLKEVIHSAGGVQRERVILPVFTDELTNILEVAVHQPVKDLDDCMLVAMGCSPDEDRRDNRYGLLTGVLIICRDVDGFTAYLLEKGE